ncbi:unnamed protein product [Linum tenue]|uniref:Ubiquitin carboxyl-terminal hydrolase 7 ICP0-binding domain-containing protein n=1 Tax=Linum tenue TaxID=586396 RepID=A0AAV0Q841_9ROSI|nr:unnamed protein product [Linum tenue]
MISKFTDPVDIFVFFLVLLQKRLNTGQESNADREELQCVIIKVARDEDIRNQVGKSRHFDLVDHAKVESFCVEKHVRFNVFKEKVAAELGIPVQFQRFWRWAFRHNGGRDTWRGQWCKTELVFGSRNYVGSVMVKSSSKPADVVARLNEMAGYPLDENIDLYEEVMYEPNLMIELIDKELSFSSGQVLAAKLVELKTELDGSRSEAIDLRNQNQKLEEEVKELRTKVNT